MQNSSVSAHIREHREKAGLTQAQLAEAVFATRQTVGNWERGATLPDIQSLQLLAGVFGVTVATPTSWRARRRTTGAC